MLLKSRQDFYKVPAGKANFQVKSRSETRFLDFPNIFQNRLCIHFTGALKTNILLFHFFKNYRSGHSEVFLRKGVLKICSKFTGEHLCRSGISIDCTSAWVFSCKFATYFQNTFSTKHLWMAVSETNKWEQLKYQ